MRHGEFHSIPFENAVTILTASIFARIVVQQEELLQLKNIPKSLAVFCLATYGEGDPTDNAMEFFEWIQGDVDLTGLNYAVSLFLVSNRILFLFSYDANGRTMEKFLSSVDSVIGNSS